MINFHWFEAWRNPEKYREHSWLTKNEIYQSCTGNLFLSNKTRNNIGLYVVWRYAHVAVVVLLK